MRGAGAALLLALVLAPAVPPPAAAQAAPPTATTPPAIDEGYAWIRDLLADQRRLRREAAARLIARGDRGLLFGVVDALFFIARPFRGEAFEVLEALSGEKPGRSYWDWVALAGRLETVPPAPGYAHWKASLFAHLDPAYRQMLDPAAPRLLRLEEVVSGGVKPDGIPALDDPAMAAAAEAGYLDPDEEIFGLYRGGEARAYPRRFLDWHELLNDQIGGEPVTLSYCTLCGAAVAYLAAGPDGRPYRFGTSGLLYRSNKLMFDRATLSLWSNLEGRPVVGPLAGRGIELPLLPVVRTTWRDWRRRHPETQVMVPDRRLREVALAHGFDYAPGKADRARRGVRFPVPRESPALPPREEVFVLRLADGAKAYPLEKLLAAGLVEDEAFGQPVLLLADPGSGAVRAYLRPPVRLAGALARGPGERLEAAGGGRWRIAEEALRGEQGAPDFARLPGHLAFWFGWYAFFPQTEVWTEPAQGAAGTHSANGGL